jgi:hypothetical protein
MYKLTRLVALLFAFVLMLALGLSLAAAAPASKDSTTNKTTNTMKTKPSASKSAVKSTAKSFASKSRHVLASAEDLSGTITRVDPSDREVTLIGSNGVPYDFKVNQKTMVELSSHKIGMNELASESQKQATIHFVPRSDGNLAQSIRISAS